MSFLVKQPSLPQGGGAGDPKLSAGYRAAEIVPQGWGFDVYPSKWISDKYDAHTARAGDNRPDWQYCSILAAYCVGPIDYVGNVFSNGKHIAVFDYYFEEGEESHTFTLNPSLKSGRAWQAVVHRGTAAATAAGFANARAKTGQNHGPYRDYVVIEWKNIDLGGGVTSLPLLAVEFGKKTPAVDDYAAGFDRRYGVNPIAAVHALCKAATGGDFDPALLDDEHWGDQAAALDTIGVAGRTGDLVKCHPVLSSSTSLADAVSQILAYIDGYIYAHEGKLRVGWFPSAAVDPSELPEIAEGDLESKPSGPGFPDWNEGATSVVVAYRSHDKHFNEDAERYNAPGNRENAVMAEPVVRQRPFIHSGDQAAMMAAADAVDPNSADMTAQLQVLKSRAVADGELLMPGDLINWDYGPHSLDLVCRVIARRMRMGAASDILTIARERGAYPRPYVAAVDDRVIPIEDEPGEIDTDDVRFYLLPSGISTTRKVAPLINRANRSIYRADIHMSVDGSAPWDVVLDCRNFVAKCAEVGDIDDEETTIRVSSASVDFDRMAEQTDVGQANDLLLLLVDDELLSVGSITVVSPGVYDLGVLRGRRGTTAAAHLNGEVSWLFERADIDGFEHIELYNVRDGSNEYDVDIATKYFKVQLFTIAVEGEAKPDDPGIAFILPDLGADETLGYTIVISNEAHTVACAEDGTVNAGQLGGAGTAKTSVQVYRGGTPLTPVASDPNSDQFSIALGTLTATTATKEDDDTVRCDTLTADTGIIEILVNVAGAFEVYKTFTLTKAKKGVTGDVGDTGATGAPGPGLVYQGAYDPDEFYYHTADRRDVVSYGGSYYIANNMAKSGLDTWGVPGVADWAAFSATFRSVATALLLAEDATITKTLTIGESGADIGLIQSADYDGFEGWAIKHDGTAGFKQIDIFGGAIKVGLYDDISDIPFIDFVDDDARGDASVHLERLTTDGLSPNSNWTRGRLWLRDVDLDGSFAKVKGNFAHFEPSGMEAGYGDSDTADTNLYRAAANRWKTDDRFDAALGFYTPNWAKYHGANEDGATDDLGYLQAMITAASTGENVYLTPGKSYKVSANWNINKAVRLVAYGAKIVCAADALDPSTFSSLVKLTADGITIEGLELDGAYSSDSKDLDKGTLVRVEANNCRIKNAILHAAPGCAIDGIGNRVRGRVTGCTIYDVFTGIYLDDSGGNQPTFWDIRNNVIRDGLSDHGARSGGIKISGTGSGASRAGHRITNNELTLPGEVGIELQTWVNDCIVSNNYVYCPGICISFAQVQRCQANSNEVRISGASSYGIGLESAGDGSHQNQHISFTGNHVYGYDLGGTQRGSIGISISEDQLHTVVTGGFVDGFNNAGGRTQGSTGADSVSFTGVTFTRCFVPVVFCNSKNWKVNGCSMDAGAGTSYCFLTLDTTDGEVSDWEFTNNKLYGGDTQNCGIQFYIPGTNQIKNGLLSGNNSSAFTGGSTDFFNCSGTGGVAYVRKIRCHGNTWDPASGSTNEVAWSYTGVTRSTSLTRRYAFWAYQDARIPFDTSGGDKDFELPDIGDVPPFFRVTPFKSSSDGNKVVCKSVASQEMVGKDQGGTAVFVTTLNLTGNQGSITFEAVGAYWHIIDAR